MNIKTNIMTTQGKVNEAFVSTLDNRTFFKVISNIANHYGISQEEALEEVCDNEAENIMDYITGSIRQSVSLLFNKFKVTLS
jgi:hypothetical protein